MTVAGLHPTRSAIPWRDSWGSAHATLERHPDAVVTITDNVRQASAGEREALASLRAGSVPDAVDWYAAANRTLVAPDRLGALVAMVEAWSADVDAGHDAALYAFRRHNVTDLNRLARSVCRTAGSLVGPDLVAPGGRLFAVGDRVVLTTPNNPKGLVNAERASVVAVDSVLQALTLRTSAGRTVTLAGDEIDADHLAHGNALTVHRVQGATTDRAHVFADGGGRQLGYVAMSRARRRSTVHAVADTLDQALDDLHTDWTTDRSQRWLTSTTSPGPYPSPLPVDPVLRAAVIRAELDALDRLAPPDMTAALARAQFGLARLTRERNDLLHGTGRHANTPEGRAARHYKDTRQARLAAERRASSPAVGWRERRRARQDVHRLTDIEATAQGRWGSVVDPALVELHRQIAETTTEAEGMEDQAKFRERWLREHPAHTARMNRLAHDLALVQQAEPTPRSRLAPRQPDRGIAL